jgi:hypothetical protein
MQLEAAERTLLKSCVLNVNQVEQNISRLNYNNQPMTLAITTLVEDNDI